MSLIYVVYDAGQEISNQFLLSCAAVIITS